MQQRGMKALLFGVLFALAGCASDPFADYAPLDGAIQAPHPKTVPQASRDGEILPGYDVARSFFPLALSGALVDHSRGAARGYHTALLADFNAVVADPDQPLEAQLAAADGSRLQLLRATPSESWGRLQHAALLDASDIAVVPMPRGTVGRDAFARSVRQHEGRPVWALAAGQRAHRQWRDAARPGRSAGNGFCRADGRRHRPDLAWRGQLRRAQMPACWASRRRRSRITASRPATACRR
jgi:hypothetical protein